MRDTGNEHPTQGACNNTHANELDALKKKARKAGLRDSDLSTLARTLDLETRFDAGIFPRGGPQTLHFNRLVRLGMLRDTGEWGRDIDCEVDADVRLYKLTDLGRTTIKAIEDAADAIPYMRTTPAEMLRCAAVGLYQAREVLGELAERIERAGASSLRAEDLEAICSTLEDLGRAEEDIRGVAMGLEKAGAS